VGAGGQLVDVRSLKEVQGVTPHQSANESPAELYWESVHASEDSGTL